MSPLFSAGRASYVAAHGLLKSGSGSAQGETGKQSGSDKPQEKSFSGGISGCKIEPRRENFNDSRLYGKLQGRKSLISEQEIAAAARISQKKRNDLEKIDESQTNLALTGRQQRLLSDTCIPFTPSLISGAGGTLSQMSNPSGNKESPMKRFHSTCSVLNRQTSNRIVEKSRRDSKEKMRGDHLSSTSSLEDNGLKLNGNGYRCHRGSICSLLGGATESDNDGTSSPLGGSTDDINCLIVDFNSQENVNQIRLTSDQVSKPQVPPLYEPKHREFFLSTLKNQNKYHKSPLNPIQANPSIPHSLISQKPMISTAKPPSIFPEFANNSTNAYNSGSSKFKFVNGKASSPVLDTRQPGAQIKFSPTKVQKRPSLPGFVNRTPLRAAETRKPDNPFGPFGCHESSLNGN